MPAAISSSQIDLYSQRSAIIRWLDRNGWPYVLGGVDGWPRVSRQLHDQESLGVKVAAVEGKRVEPNWKRPTEPGLDAFKNRKRRDMRGRPLRTDALSRRGRETFGRLVLKSL